MAIEHTDLNIGVGEVIQYLRRKNDVNEFEPISWLGAEQRFVGPLRNSNVNNLEEQYTIGTDTYVITYKDEYGNTIREEHFCITGTHDLEDAGDHYVLISKFFNDVHVDTDIAFGESELIIYEGLAIFGDSSSTYSDTNSIYFLDTNRFNFDEDGSLLIVNDNVSDYIQLREDNLYYIRTNSELIEDERNLLVATKITEFKYSDDGKKIIREKIYNHLLTSSLKEDNTV